MTEELAMIYKTTEEVIKLVKAFEARAILKKDWTHPKQLTIGLYYCLRFPFGKAINLMREGLSRLDEAYGIENTVANGYNETLTVFWMLTTKQFVETSKCFSLAEQANQLINIYRDEKLPLQYYSKELLNSPAARRQHLPPDLDIFYLFVNSARLVSNNGVEATLSRI